ncbi:hypothetical protein [Curtobacterium flaccumfaciens]|uniref:hypothetical protein n=1 Tax=Curtobacterium flaccumfaciens TaxID=2035 RepID=UPI0039967C55
MGTLRSTETQESEGSGDNISEARQAAIAALNLDGFELQQANGHQQGNGGDHHQGSSPVDRDKAARGQRSELLCCVAVLPGFDP